MTERRRRRHTRWLILTPLATLAVIVAGTVALEAAHPQANTTGLAVEGLPPLAMDEAHSCARRVDETPVDGIRAALRPDLRVTSTQVYACPIAFDGQRVAYAGEVVGEVLARDGGAWAQVNDDAYALEVGPVIGHREHAGFNTGLSVWLPDGLHEQIEAPGRAGRRGDVILVTGTLLRADPADGGGTTLRAEDLRVLAEPVDIAAPLHSVQALVATALALTALASVWYQGRARRDKR